MPVRRSLWGALAAAALFGISCRGCRESRPQSVREIIPARAGTVLLADDLSRLVRGAEAFATRATQKAGAAALARARASLADQVGLDPLDLGSYENWGIDVRGGLAVFTETLGEPVLAVAVRDAGKFDEALRALLTKNEGANKFSEEREGAFTLRVAGRSFGTETVPSMYWAHVGSFALVSRGDGRRALAATLARWSTSQQGGTPPLSLAEDGTSRELTAKVSAGDLVVLARPEATGATTAGAVAAQSGGVVTSVRVDASGFASDTFVSLNVPGLEAAFKGPAPADLAARIDEDAVLALLSQTAHADALAVFKAAPGMGPLVERTFAPLRTEVGLDPERDIAPLLAGPVTASIHAGELASVPVELGRGSRRTLSGLLDLVHVVLTAEVKDPTAMAALLERSRAALQARGVPVHRRVEKRGEHEVTVFYPELKPPRGAASEPRLGWALVGRVYVYAAGRGRLGRALDLLTRGGASLAGQFGPAASSLAAQHGSSLLVLRSAALAARGAAWTTQDGAQPSLGPLVATTIELLRALGDIAVGMKAEPGGLRVQVREQLQ